MIKGDTRSLDYSSYHNPTTSLKLIIPDLIEYTTMGTFDTREVGVLSG